MSSGFPLELLEKARLRRSELTQELKALDNLIIVYERLLSASGSESADSGEQRELEFGGSKRALHAAYVAEMIDVARKMIIEERRPLKRGELVKRLTERGYEIEGTDKNKVFGTNLWRSGKFRSIEGHGYWPKDVPLPKS